MTGLWMSFPALIGGGWTFFITSFWAQEDLVDVTLAFTSRIGRKGGRMPSWDHLRFPTNASKMFLPAPIYWMDTNSELLTTDL